MDEDISKYLPPNLRSEKREEEIRNWLERSYSAEEVTQATDLSQYATTELSPDSKKIKDLQARLLIAEEAIRNLTQRLDAIAGAK